MERLLSLLASFRFAPASLLLAAVCLFPIFPAFPVVGCKAQTTGSAPLTPEQDRRIAVLVRAQLSVPPDWEIVPGARSASDMPGYDTLQVNFFPAADPSHKQPVDFLISKDGNTLARLAKYSLKDVPGMDIPTAGRPVRGDKDARVEIVNFDDLECPYCARMHAELFPATLDHYKGLVKIVYKDDPLTEIHPWAMHAAIDANCLAAENGDAYWKYVDYLHTHGEDITGPDRDAAKSDAMLDKLANDEGARGKLNKATLAACVSKQDGTAVRASMKEAEALRIEGTPALFIDGDRVDGAQPIPYVWATIDRALRAKGVTPPPEPVASAPASAPAPGAAR